MQHPSHGEKRNLVIIQRKGGLVVLEIIFHARAHHESSKNCRQQENNVQPITLLQRFYNEHFYRTVIIRRGRRNWGKKFRHQDSTVREQVRALRPYLHRTGEIDLSRWTAIPCRV